MVYVSKWERLFDALNRVMAADGRPEEEVQRDICQAIADGVVSIQGKLKRQVIRHSTAWDTILPGDAFQIPVAIKPNDFDWQNSRPLKPWRVKRGGFSIPGDWELEWIEVCRADVTDVLCVCEQDKPTQNASNQAAMIRRSQSSLRGQGMPVGDRAKSQNPRATGSPRRRGVRPRKFEQTRDVMRADIQLKRLSMEQLAEMLEKSLSERYGVSRDTARKARNAVLSEHGEN